ncbi:GNAT family N-acetyltransferase [Streptomyces sp. NBC_00268]|uniref:GNAT family N-acetyltransferase n=1 Tax=Streptomyces sp. NBC_00268 TaxID=2975695 RepID=UPI00225793FA|nr:GNAT family N-acetyltransferase [Streptomyces sp. NBC_00268]MCX5191504.1 GNAT family N-acetyltransferase [Streptomyces sp. NBC_00268]
MLPPFFSVPVKPGRLTGSIRAHCASADGTPEPTNEAARPLHAADDLVVHSHVSSRCWRPSRDRYNASPAELEAGICAFYVLVAEDGSVLGRFNLYDLEDGIARLGYRVAERAAGRGVATAAVRELCRLAVVRHGLRPLRAATSRNNAASRRVLTKAGFVPVGPADPADLGGKPGTWYQHDLVLQP